MKNIFLLLGGLLAALGASAQSTPAKPAELLLLGTFHFHNPGADIVKTKTFDVLAPRPQAELEALTDRIKAFGPQKIFVEWPYNEQAGLDELYQAYLGGQYEAYVKGKFAPKQHNFLLKNEIIQLAFRAGKKAGVPRIYAFDYNKTTFPFDSMQRAMKAAGQEQLQQRFDATFQTITAEQNRQIETLTLTQILLEQNSARSLATNKDAYIELFNRAGGPDNFIGAYLVAEWYRRNLYMYALVQKLTAPTDERVLALVGTGHAAMMREFVQSDHRFRLRELREVLNK